MHELDASEALRSRRLYLVSKECLEVVEVAQLAGLADALAAREALVAVEFEAVVHVVEVADEEQNRANGGSRATLPRVAVHDQNILRVSCSHERRDSER